MEFGVDYSDEKHERQTGRGAEFGSNVILMGATGAGKTTAGRFLARLIGYGFVDLDATIEAREKKSVEAIFASQGEPYFRQLEQELIARLAPVRTHVIALGGGAAMDDESWEILQHMGTTVWINTPPEEIARRLVADDDELKKRPLLAELLGDKDKEQRLKQLTDRVKALIGNRQGRYKQARLVVSDSFSTPETTAQLIKESLVKEGFLTFPPDHRPYDRWRVL